MEKTQEQKEQEQFNALMDECSKAADVVISQNNRLLRAIKSVKGEKFYKDLCRLLKNEYAGGGFFPFKDEIVRKPEGKFEKTKYGQIKGFYYDEYEHGGMEGDSFSGYYFIEIKPNRYLKTHYSL